MERQEEEVVEAEVEMEVEVEVLLSVYLGIWPDERVWERFSAGSDSTIKNPS